MFAGDRWPVALLGGVFWVLLLVSGGCQRQAGPQVQVFCVARTLRVDQVLQGFYRDWGAPAPPVLEAGGSWDRGKTLVQQLAAEPFELLIVLGTPALSLVAPKIKRRPVVFGMVADPYFTGAAYDRRHPEDHQGNITGIASPPPLAAALEQGARLLPQYRRWGLLYDSLEGSSLELRQQFEQLAPIYGLTPVVRPASSETAAEAGLNTLRGLGVRVVFIPPDQNARRYAPRLLEWGREQKLLVVNGHSDFQASGAILSVTTDYQAVGKLLAALARRVLQGEKPTHIPIQHETPLQVKVDEHLLRKWSSYPPVQ